jgi:hypothetical protein
MFGTNFHHAGQNLIMWELKLVCGCMDCHVQRFFIVFEHIGCHAGVNVIIFGGQFD